MSISIWLVLVLGLAHWIGDFLLQSDWMGTNKSKRSDVLMLHVAIYTATITSITAMWVGVSYSLLGFTGWTFLLHFWTDYVTSRITTRLYLAGKRHWFFVVIGFDQLLHLCALVLTAAWWL